VNTKLLLVTTTVLGFSTVAASAADLTASSPTTPAHVDSITATDVDSSGTSATDSQMEEIQVTGYRASLDAAQSMKKESAEVIEAIAPEDLGKFTDNSIAGALQRLPGVEVDQNTDGRTGDHVSIRGIGSEYVTTTVNGRTPLGYGYEGMTELREFPIDIFPTEVLSGAVVYKTPSAEQIESGLAGTVDLQTLKPLDAKTKDGGNYFGELTLKTDNNSGDSGWGRGVSGIAGGKFFDGTLGVYAAGVVSSDYLVENFEETRPTYVNLNVANSGGGVSTLNNIEFPSAELLGQINKKTSRDAVSTGLQWKPSDAFELSADYTFSRFDKPANWLIEYLAPPTGGTFGPGGLTIQNGAVTGYNYAHYTPATGQPSTFGLAYYPYDYDNVDTMHVGGLNAKWQNEQWTATGDVSGSLTDTLGSYLGDYIVGSNIPLSSVNYSSSSSGPAVYDAGAPIGSIPSTYFPALRYEQNHSYSFAVKFDLAYQASDDLTYKIGVRYSDAHIDIRDIVNNFNVAAADVPTVTGLVFPGGTTTIFPGQNIGSNTQYIQSPAALAKSGLAFYPTKGSASPLLNGSFFGSANSVNGWQEDVSVAHTNREKTEAIYAQADFKGTLFGVRFAGNGGVRVVRTEEAAQAFQSVEQVALPDYVPIGANTLVPVTASNSYTDALPAFNTTFFLTSDTDARFAVGETLSRPEFEDISPIASISIPPAASGAPGQAQTGNPNLKPETAWNFDATVDHYLAGGGSLVGSVFFKRVYNFIYPVNSENASIPGYAIPFNSILPENVSGGRVYGLELAFNLPLDRLWDKLDGFGVNGNYAYVSSKIDDSGLGNVPFLGSSKNNSNASVYYSKGRLDTRLSMVYRSNFLSKFPQSPAFVNTYTEGSVTLDASATYALMDHLSFTVTAINLAQTPRQDYLNQPSTFLDYYTQPRQIVLALRGSL
jgi:TonB-dependent receptor